MKKCTKAIAILLVCLMFFQMVPIFPMQVFAEDDTQAPSIPSGLTLISKTQTNVSFSWSESTDDIGVTSYIVFRDGTQIETSATASFYDSSLSANTTYIYTVKASDAAGNLSAESEQLSVTTAPIPDTEVPSAPENLVMASKQTRPYH